MRIHIGAGAIFLRDWVNVDLPLPHVYLAKERPDLVERFITSEDDYYGRHAEMSPDVLRAGPVTKETVCDVYGSFSFLPARDGTVSEILSRQAFEHLDRSAAKESLRECHRVLQHGGTLRIDVPDPDETLKLYGQTKDVFYIRHLFGPRRDLWGFHTHWTRAMLTDLVRNHGFEFESERENIHKWYPAFELAFRRE